ncbi:MAG TPA: nucleotidyltransferase domain-containing protein [Lachnospiraceae bacterium]|nr:nucleotidyltransferase domain-containing protein [Lachnospiraceae bacterium]
MDGTGIKSIVITEIRELARRYQVEKVILFGSRARGDYKRTSDIDLAVSGGDIARFALDVEEETSTLLKYDIVSLDQPVQEDLMASIEREGRVLYEKI